MAELLSTEQLDMAKVLRECAAEERERPSSGPLTATGMDIAAGEIEQLRLDLAQQALNGQTVMEQQKEIQRLERANEHLRDALREHSAPDVPDEPKRRYEFDRYVNGKLKAQGVVVHAANIDEAIEKAHGLRESNADELRLRPDDTRG